MVGIGGISVIALGSNKVRVNVKCEHCGTAYYYELARTGMGESRFSLLTHVFSTISAAIFKMEDQIKDRLESEAELVPCPKCHWVNQELVEGYRRTRRRPWLERLKSLGVLVCIGIGFGVYSLVTDGLGPGFWITASFGATLASIVAIYYVAHLLSYRFLINPNRKFPSQPEIPIGTPAAQVKNSNSLHTPTPKNQPPLIQEENIRTVLFQVGLSEFPSNCFKCNETSHSTIPYVYEKVNSFSKTDRFAMNIPICSTCQKQREKKEMIVALICFCPFVILAIVSAWRAFQTNLLFLIGSFMFAGVGAIFSGMVHRFFFRPVNIQIVDSERAILELRFPNQSFMREVRDRNKFS